MVTGLNGIYLDIMIGEKLSLIQLDNKDLVQLQSKFILQDERLWGKGCRRESLNQPTVSFTVRTQNLMQNPTINIAIGTGL